jgi:hypothetical protein
MTDHELVECYSEAARAHDTAEIGTGNRAQAFIRMLVAERVLTTCQAGLPSVLRNYREQYSP